MDARFAPSIAIWLHFFSYFSTDGSDLTSAKAIASVANRYPPPPPQDYGISGVAICRIADSQLLNPHVIVSHLAFDD